MKFIGKTLVKQQAAELQIAHDKTESDLEHVKEDTDSGIERDTEDVNSEESSTSTTTNQNKATDDTTIKPKEDEEKFPWRKTLVEATKLKWQKDLIKECECEDVAKKVVSTEEKWRGTLISELGQDGLWKVRAGGKIVEKLVYTSLKIIFVTCSSTGLVLPISGLKVHLLAF